jgi:inorganic pyrophosphatase
MTPAEPPAGVGGRLSRPPGLQADPAPWRRCRLRASLTHLRTRTLGVAARYCSPMNTQYADAFPGVVEIVVEIQRGTRNKYEFDEVAGVYRLDRVLSSAVFYNFDYGFIEGTRADDGDHTDALLIIDEPTFTGCHVWARPIGGLEMRDEKGFDFKTLCVAIGDPHQQHIERLEQMRPHRLVEIEHFFNTYKLLEEKDVDVLGWRDRERALEVLAADRVRFQNEHGG